MSGDAVGGDAVGGDAAGRDAWDDLVRGGAREPGGRRDVAPGGVRVLAGVGGLLLVALAIVVTGGVAIAGFVGMGVTALVCGARRRPYTRAAGWVGAMLATTLAFAGLFAIAAANVPRNTFSQVQQEMTVAARRPAPPPDAVQRTVERMYPGSTAISKAQTDAMTRTMASSPGVFWGSIAFGLLFAGGTLGAMAGSVAWGSATVLLFGVLGRWPSIRRAPPVTFSHAPDAFDAIG